MRTLGGELERTVVMLLAGGKGERLYPLTRDRSKPAVPFGGIYRIVDFTLSNCINSGLTRICVLTQYKSYSLDRHIRLGWNIVSAELREYLFTIPPQLRTGARWYEGTADAIYQNVYTIEMERPERVLVLSGDHVYRMDYRRMMQSHLEQGAQCTVAATEVPVEKARGQLGVVEVDDSLRIVGFQEKPEKPAPVPGKADVCLSNMGVYLFDTATLVEAVTQDAGKPTSHDFGRDIIPGLVGESSVFAYPFGREAGASPYWKDIGTLQGYWEASMDLVSSSPPLDLFDPSWPFRTHQRQFPPARVVRGPGEKESTVTACLICPGCFINGASVESSILSPEVRVEPGAQVRESVLMDGTLVGGGAVVNRAILDKNVQIPVGYRVGTDLEADKAQFVMTPDGIPVIPKGWSPTQR